MPKPFLPAALAASVFLASCGGAQPPAASRQNTNAPANSTQTSLQHGTSPANLGAASSHGGGAGATAAGVATAKAPVETPELDARVEKAEAKAKASGAGDVDRKAAAAAYFARADFFRDQGSPALYKFALRDYRIGLRYDPAAKEPREKMEEIVQIYQSMGRPVPDLGNEQ